MLLIPFPQRPLVDDGCANHRRVQLGISEQARNRANIIFQFPQKRHQRMALIMGADSNGCLQVPHANLKVDAPNWPPGECLGGNMKI